MMSLKREPSADGTETHDHKKARIREEKDIEEASEEEEEEDSEEYESASDTEMTETSSTLQPQELSRRKQQIMSEYRRVTSELSNERAKVAREGGLKHVTELLQRINELKDTAKKYNLTQDISLHDSRNLKEVGDLMGLGMRNIKIGSTDKALRPAEFIRRLKTHILADSMHIAMNDGDGERSRENFLERPHPFGVFNWFLLGTYLYTRGSKPVSTSHLLGPLEIEKKVRVMKARSKLDFSNKTVTAENVTSEELNTNSTNQTTNAVQKCFMTFQDKTQQGQRINIFRYFINPKSFSQSIENMFYTSFLIRDGKLALDEDEEGYPVVSELPPLPSEPKLRDQEIARRRAKPSNHIIFQLEYESWKNLVKKFNITESFIPHRPE